MDAQNEIRVTLSNELMKHLRKEAEQQHVPLRWLVAGLVCDTFEKTKPVTPAKRSLFAGR
jgi:hypothetical protein